MYIFQDSHERDHEEEGLADCELTEMERDDDAADTQIEEDDDERVEETERATRKLRRVWIID